MPRHQFRNNSRGFARHLLFGGNGAVSSSREARAVLSEISTFTGVICAVHRSHGLRMLLCRQCVERHRVESPYGHLGVVSRSSDRLSNRFAVGWSVTKSDPYTSALPDGVFDVELAWALLLTLAQQAREARPLQTAVGFGLVRDGFRQVPIEEALCIIDPRARPGRQVEVRRRLAVHPEVRGVFELYLPLVIGEQARELVVGHMGPQDASAQSGMLEPLLKTKEELIHTHRMRALFDAVIIGVSTALWDDPELTTRLVPGPNPTRVILDPQGRLEGDLRLLTYPDSHTIVCVDQSVLPKRKSRGHVDYVGIPVGESGFDARSLFQSLRAAFGLRRIVVEGGKTTVTRLLAAGMLDRVQVSVAPVLLGPGSALRLSPIEAFKEALAPSCRHFRLGADAFLDFDLLAKPGNASA